ncbi:MAG: hypothetical protein EOP06_19175 [Proteobacteria bacterium]|nr:MAG: hypothetical protein EOP06_19175 [Pseudomonadota bacterium]
MMDGVTFLNPGFFWLLILIPVLAAWYIWNSPPVNCQRV